MSELPLELGAAPPIDTERLSLRGYRRDDFADCAPMWGDPSVTRYIGGRPQTPEEVWARLLRYVGHWAVMGYGYWAVRERATGRYVGDVGFADYKRDLEPALPDDPEMGWILAPWAHGKGYATEAVRAALAWGAARFDGGRTFCIIDPGNAASVRVADRCGFEPAGQVSLRGEPLLVFARAT